MTTFPVLTNEPNRMTFQAGATIFAEGEKGDNMYYIVAGQVNIRRRDKVLNTLGSGEIFGEMALLDDSPRSATAVAADQVTVAAVNQKRFLQMIAGTPFFAVQVMQVIAERLRHSNES
jgi:CRP/FNR family transcriptional regulator, cyclic AMP receptor protein